jgi:hypothetical protein
MKNLEKIMAVGQPIRRLKACLGPAPNLPGAASGLPATGLTPADDPPGEAQDLPMICQNLPATVSTVINGGVGVK